MAFSPSALASLDDYTAGGNRQIFFSLIAWKTSSFRFFPCCYELLMKLNQISLSPLNIQADNKVYKGTIPQPVFLETGEVFPHLSFLSYAPLQDCPRGVLPRFTSYSPTRISTSKLSLATPLGLHSHRW